MSNTSIFNILGPIMVGPSSSHTAGAVRLGRVTLAICGSDICFATFYLHGSFAKTYKGHGTDRALIAGILGMETDDERIKNSINIANSMGIGIKFIQKNLGEVHPNTVKIVLNKKDGSKISVTGSSIGGGNIIITKINEDNVSLDCKYPAMIIKHYDILGIIGRICSTIAMNNINIANLEVKRIAKANIATTVIETDNQIPESTVTEIKKIENVISVLIANIV